MKLIFLDTETTGLDPFQHAPIEIAYKILDLNRSKFLSSYHAVIQQTPEVWASADPKSCSIHGITWEEVSGGRPHATVADQIIQDFHHAKIGDGDAAFVCQNPSFDRPFFQHLISSDLQREYNWPYHWLDLASMYFALRTHEGHLFTAEKQLSKNEIAATYELGEEATPHRAMQGVEHLIACFEALFSNVKAAH